MFSKRLTEQMHSVEDLVNPSLDFGTKYAIFLFLAFIVAQVVGGFIVPFFAGIYFGAQGYRLTEPEVLESFRPTFLLLGVYGGGITAGATVFWLTRHWAKSLFSDKSPSGIAWVRTSWSGIIYGVGGGLLLAALVLSMTYLMPVDESALKGPIAELLRMPGLPQIAIVIFLIGVLPLVEEFLFRGAMFSALARGKGIVVATVGTTLMFVAIHFPDKIYYWPGFVAVGLLGLVTVALRLRFCSLVPCVITHVVYNASLMSLSLGVDY